MVATRPLAEHGLPGEPAGELAGLRAQWHDVTLCLGAGQARTLRLVAPADPEGLLDTPVTQTRFEREGYIPYWAWLWPAAAVMAERVGGLLAETGAQRVLELGCGLGLPGVCAALEGADVLCTDHDHAALAYAQRNAQLAGCAVRAAWLDWRDPAALGERDWPLIIGSDLVYDAGMIPALCDCVNALLAPSGLFACATPQRKHVPQAVGLLQRAGLHVTTVSDATFLPDGQASEVDVLLVQRLKPGA